jgi:hypothetical protein
MHIYNIYVCSDIVHAHMILKFGWIFVAVEADRISEKLQSYVNLLCMCGELCWLRNTAYFNIFSQFVTGMHVHYRDWREGSSSFRCANQESAKIN